MSAFSFAERKIAVPSKKPPGAKEIPLYWNVWKPRPAISSSVAPSGSPADGLVSVVAGVVGTAESSACWFAGGGSAHELSCTSHSSTHAKRHTPQRGHVVM